jgi:hypothetical protein
LGVGTTRDSVDNICEALDETDLFLGSDECVLEYFVE